MHLICAYCGRYIKEKEPFEVIRTTHGICPDCYIPLLQQNQGISCDEYLETFDLPVVILDSQQRVAAGNKAALDMMGKTNERIAGFSSGEILECLHSNLPERCGNTTYCEACTFMNLVLRTMERRISHHHKHVSVETKQGRNEFLVSSIYMDGRVQIVFENWSLNAG
jgi:PAS domain-containing protein